MIAHGRIISVQPGLIEVEVPGAALAQSVSFETVPRISGTVRALSADRAVVAVHGDARGIRTGGIVRADLCAGRLPLGTCALGRAFDARGIPIDDGPPLGGRTVSITRSAVPVEERTAIAMPLWTGVKSIDALLTIGRGARVGIFGPPGAGKSTLLETIVDGAAADAVVIALVGERAREAQSWIARINAHTSIVCATSDRSAAERICAADVAIAHATALASRGLHVLVILDSLARYAAALREVAVSAGESSGRAGYPPSVFASLARLVERCGAFRSGSITLLATVLSDGDERDPVSEAARSLLDGHVQLSTKLAHAGRFPAIDVLASASRTMDAVIDEQHAKTARRLRSALAALESVADARSLGIEPSDPAIGTAIAVESRIEGFLRQSRTPVPAAEVLRMAREIADTLEESHGYPN